MSATNKIASICAATLMVANVLVSRAGEADGPLIPDVEAAVELALRHNPDLKTALDNENQAFARIREVAAGALPRLSLSSNYTRAVRRPVFFFDLGGQVQKIQIGSNNAYVGNLHLEQTIFQNGQLGVRKARRIADLFSESSREGARLTRDEVILNVRKAYYSVLLSQRIVAVFKETFSQTEAHFQDVKKKYEAGVSAEFDLLRSDVDRSEAKAGLLEAQNRLEMAKSALKNAIGLPLASNVDVRGELEYKPLPGKQIETQSLAALSLRPEMKQLNLQLEMARLNTSIQRGRYLPSLSLVGDYQFQGQSSDFRFGATERSTSLTAGLNLRFDIFDGFAARARTQQARARASAIEHQAESVARLIEMEVEQASLRMKNAQERIAARGKSVEQAKKAHDIAEVRYDSGIGTQLELFDARLALNRTQTNYLRAIYDYNIALCDWQKAVGIIQ